MNGATAELHEPVVPTWSGHMRLHDEVSSKSVSIVIPALNEEASIGDVLREIPRGGLEELGYTSEVIVVDNGSTDRTRRAAEACGARVVHEPRRGYGNAYRSGFAAATGEIIATGDADLTYPFEVIPDVVRLIELEGLDFINTNRLRTLEPGSMNRSHRVGNWGLSAVARGLFGLPFEDSQSGMWVFRRSILSRLSLQSTGWTFSQELKIQAYLNGFRCREVPIRFRGRTGTSKLAAVRIGVVDACHLVGMRMSQTT